MSSRKHQRTSRSKEILNIYKENKQTENEKRQKKEWRDDLERLIHRQFPDLRLVFAGSSNCGLATQGSDCDFTLVKQASSFTRTDGVSVLHGIERSVVQLSTRVETELINTAVVPILILKDRSRGLEGDISYNAENTLYNTFLMHCYGQMDPRVRPLVITVKTWAKNAGITNARYHKLSGFAVVLLVFHYLQHGCCPPVLPSLQEKYPIFFSSLNPNRIASYLEEEFTPQDISDYESANCDRLSILLKGFFRYYSNFNWREVISVRTGSFVRLPSDRKWTRPYIRIEDPNDLRNVTRAVYESDCFEKIKRAITTASEEFDRGVNISDIVS